MELTYIKIGSSGRRLEIIGAHKTWGIVSLTEQRGQKNAVESSSLRSFAICLLEARPGPPSRYEPIQTNKQTHKLRAL
jgi:hypothetical protein